MVERTLNFPDPHQGVYAKTLFGFWMYIMTDCLIFGTLFATYFVLRIGTYGGPGPQELFDLPFVLVETMCLLISSFTCGMAMLDAYQDRKKHAIAWLIVTFLFGASFVGLEVSEFAHLVHEGNSWERSGFLSAFFTLVGTHGFHVSIGLLWMVVMMFVIAKRGFTPSTIRRLACFRLFWHFLDVVWIFIFTFVYLMGVIG
jgi:cytochrome o ubiquinol oxidase subunit 3